jgi:hypothetical protein
VGGFRGHIYRQKYLLYYPGARQRRWGKQARDKNLGNKKVGTGYTRWEKLLKVPI